MSPLVIVSFLLGIGLFWVLHNRSRGGKFPLEFHLIPSILLITFGMFILSKLNAINTMSWLWFIDGFLLSWAIFAIGRIVKGAWYLIKDHLPASW
jgi:hypothetical protein